MFSGNGGGKFCIKSGLILFPAPQESFSFILGKDFFISLEALHYLYLYL